MVTLENNLAVSHKVNICLPDDSASPLVEKLFYIFMNFQLPFLVKQKYQNFLNAHQ